MFSRFKASLNHKLDYRDKVIELGCLTYLQHNSPATGMVDKF